MRTTTTKKLAELQRNPANIRNICILAHVDHGKTTLADTLVASNGIISQRMAGKLRYMDSREDEQLRGITMKSSAISLHYKNEVDEFLVNLIDSPGHIDFSSEVSTAVRLCDGAIVLVDVVEGVCPQTHAVLRQAWTENIKPVLVLNKVDRLVTELKMSPLEAHLHLQQILEQVNAITGELFTSQVFEKSSTKTVERKTSTDDQIYDWSTGLEETDDSSLYFSPDQGNVLFASAIHGWGFGIQHFAELFAKKLGFKAEVLTKTLWGDFYLESKTKRIRKGANARAKKPLFVQFILENLWSVYDAVLVRRDRDMIEKIVKSMNLTIQARDARHSDPSVLLQAITSQWLPLSKAVLAMVTQCLPSPLDVGNERAEKLLCSSSQRFDSLPQETQKLKDDFLACSSSEDSPIIVYVSKMFAVEAKALPQNKQRPLTSEEIAHRREVARQRHAEKQAGESSSAQTPDTGQEKNSGEIMTRSSSEVSPPRDEEKDQAFIAFARVFSGTVRSGCSLYVLGPKHDPALAQELIASHRKDMAELSNLPHVQQITVGELYMFMGKELESMEEVPAGNILGLGGMESHIIKSATLASTVMCPAFTDMFFEASPILKVALEPSHPGDVQKLVEGLKLLNQADPCVRITVQATGEHVIVAAGEVHLQKCLDDLKDRYAKVEVNVSAPQVPFRETIVPPPTVDNVNEAIEGQLSTVRPAHGGEEEGEDPELIPLQTPNRMCTIKVRASPLPNEVTELLDKNALLLKTLDLYTKAKFSQTNDEEEDGIEKVVKQSTITALQEFKNSLTQAFKSAGKVWESAIDQIWSFGPKRSGPNILLNRVPEYRRHSVWACLEGARTDEKAQLWDFDNSIVSGFQMVTLSGPLCEEPMRGVCFILEVWDMDHEMSNRERKISEKRERKVSERVRTVSGMFSGDSDDEDVEEDVKIQGLNVDDVQQNQCTDEEEEIDKNAPVLERLSLDDSAETSREVITQGQKHAPVSYGPFSGQLMSCVKEGCRRAFAAQPQRLMAAMYSCNIQATSDVLGKLYAVLGKRNGRVLEEDMKEGTSVFDIKAVIPVIESFGFAQELRKKTSGLANPLLKFSHWEVIDLDPFWVPTTEEEYLHFGEKADYDNQALHYMNQVRRQKGLKVNEKLVESGEKQRTRSRKK